MCGKMITSCAVLCACAHAQSTWTTPTITLLNSHGIAGVRSSRLQLFWPTPANALATCSRKCHACRTDEKVSDVLYPSRKKRHFGLQNVSKAPRVPHKMDIAQNSSTTCWWNETFGREASGQPFCARLLSKTENEGTFVLEEPPNLRDRTWQWM